MEKSELVLTENENGFYVNGNAVTEETFLSLRDDIEEDTNNNTCDCDVCNECEVLLDIINVVKENDTEAAMNYLRFMINEIKKETYLGALSDVADSCINAMDDITENDD